MQANRVMRTTALATCLLTSGMYNNVFAQNTPNIDGTSAKYVLLFIGDGMGLPQRIAAEKYSNHKMAMDSLPAQGITTTYAADRFITGSAAAATAIASGQKTNIGMIGMAPDQQQVKSIAEIAREKGMKVGIVSSVSVDHATPAGFYAHVPKRSQYYDIELQLADSNFDFFGGGGLKDPGNKKGIATVFKGNAVDYIKNAGYKVVTDKAAFKALKPGDGKVLTYNSWLQDGSALPYAMDMSKKDITLPEFTGKAIEMLDNPKGFFLMVEGGKIDWACHANDAAAAINNTLVFDEAVQVGIDFAKKHPGETLLVVTGDHETGGLTLGWAGTGYDSHFPALEGQKISFQKFTDEVLPDFKEKCAEKCSFEDIKPIITKDFGLKFAGDSKTDSSVASDSQIQQLEAAFNLSMEPKEESKKEIDSIYSGYNPLAVALTHTLNNNSGLGWTSYKHTAVPISTSAMGVEQNLFNGAYDNTDIAKKIMMVLGTTPEVHPLALSTSKVARN